MEYVPSLITDEFDLSFLLLSRRSARFEAFLSLHDAAANVGLHTAIATHPDQFQRLASDKRLRVIVIDANPACGLKLGAEIKKLRRSRNVAVVLMGDPDHAGGALAAQPGVDLCLPVNVGFTQFHRALIHLVQRRGPTAKAAARKPAAKPGGPPEHLRRKPATIFINLPGAPTNYD